MFGRKRKTDAELERLMDYTVPQPFYGGLSQMELEQLAKYNSERARGLVHTEQWRAKMIRLQERFDAK